jgi:hypothetical protein
MRLIIIITIFLFGCHPIFCKWEYGYTQLKKEPLRKSLVGKYILNEYSEAYLIKQGYQKEICRLELFDNNFKLTNAPSLIFINEGVSPQVFNREGKWSVSCTESNDCMIELEDICVVPLAEKDGRTAILITIGDGDECNGIVFEKVN